MSPWKTKVYSLYKEQGLSGVLDWIEKVAEFIFETEDRRDVQKALQSVKNDVVKHPEKLNGTPAEKQALKERLDRDLKLVQVAGRK